MSTPLAFIGGFILGAGMVLGIIVYSLGVSLFGWRRRPEQPPCPHGYHDWDWCPECCH